MKNIAKNLNDLFNLCNQMNKTMETVASLLSIKMPENERLQEIRYQMGCLVEETQEEIDNLFKELGFEPETGLDVVWESYRDYVKDAREYGTREIKQDAEIIWAVLQTWKDFAEDESDRILKD